MVNELYKTEMLIRYNTAKNKKQQINILADIYECSVDEVREVLGLAVPVKKAAIINQAFENAVQRMMLDNPVQKRKSFSDKFKTQASQINEALWSIYENMEFLKQFIQLDDITQDNLDEYYTKLEGFNAALLFVASEH